MVASFTSWGVALSTHTATGRPGQSATAMIFDPLPRLVLAILEPVFSLQRSSRRCLPYVEHATDFKICSKCLQDSSHDSGPHALLKSAMASLVRWIAIGNVNPGSTGAQD